MKPHLFLNNPRGESKVFKVGREIDDDDPIPEKPAETYRQLKDNLNLNLTKLSADRQEQRTLNIPDHIDYVLINFFPVFNNSEGFKTRTRFENQFGLVPVSYSHFNQTVLLAIADELKFEHFLELLSQFINSQNNVHPNGQPYHIMTLIHSFSFLNLNENLADEGTKDAILGLITPSDAIGDKYSSIFTSLLALLEESKEGNESFNYDTDFQTSIEVKNMPSEILNIILRNFDIIQSVQSLRVPTIRQNAFNQPELTWNLTIDPPDNKNVIIGIVDNGVRKIAPLENVIIDRLIDVANKQRPNPLKANHPHGTTVATLAAIGDKYSNTTENRFKADAMIMPIKILNLGVGYLNIYDIKEAIEKGIQAGVKIFNLSVCGPGKMYNEQISDYAYMLDKLAFENDILILIATGNLPEEDIEAMQRNITGDPAIHFHTYPNHFFNPYELTIEHACESTNICIPSESLNNLTVGAIADNKMEASLPNLTPFKELPAYYSRKWNLDYSRRINGRSIARKQTNYKIRKPDIVMPGGDLLTEVSRMHVIGFGENGNDFYGREAGTSLAVPLASNLAARIVNEYSSFTMQSVKALIINSAKQPQPGDLLDTVIEKVKNETAMDYFKKPFAALTSREKLSISSHLSADKLYDRIVGYGMPQDSRAIFSDSKRATIVIQDTIGLNTHKVVKLNIPDYLLKYTKTGPLLTIKATLCYRFRPVPNNQLGYNPLHISFNIFRDVTSDPRTTAKIIADKQHAWYTPFVRGIQDKDQRSKEKLKALAIKTNAESWSEDFFPTSSKPFSNTQQFEVKMNKKEIKKVNNQISIAVRCTHKRDMPSYIEEDLRKRSHDFSIVLEISERESKELRNFDLYDKLLAINELDVYPIQGLDLEAEDLEAEG